MQYDDDLIHIVVSELPIYMHTRAQNSLAGDWHFWKSCLLTSIYIGFHSLNLFISFFSMHRQPEHVMNFLLAEMGTSGSLDGQQRLVVKGRFAPKNFEGILRRYISKFLFILLLYIGVAVRT